MQKIFFFFFYTQNSNKYRLPKHSFIFIALLSKNHYGEKGTLLLFQAYLLWYPLITCQWLEVPATTHRSIVTIHPNVKGHISVIIPLESGHFLMGLKHIIHKVTLLCLKGMYSDFRCAYITSACTQFCILNGMW